MSVASRRSSSASSTELARQRDLNKYYQPWLNSRKLPAVPVDAGPEPDQVQCSHDTTLTALAQLAALRLNVKRGMVSLIETKTQIILAEATQTLSLVDGTRHDPGDHIWLGNVSLPRQDCMDEHTFGAVTTCKDSDGRDVGLSAFVVNDTFEDDRFKDRVYVTAPDGVRFYAGVPIITKQGHAIGVYGVSDTKPRPEGLTLDQIRFMQDVAQIVAEHLDRVVDAIGRVSERNFMKGISYFLEDLSEFKYNLTNSETGSKRSEAQYDAVEDVQATDPQTEPPRGRQSQASVPNPSISGSPPPPRTTENVHDPEGAPGDVLPRYSVNSKSRGKDGSEQSESDNTRRVFTQASQLFCEQAKATGCVFMDASHGVFSGLPEQGSCPPGGVDPGAGLNLNFDSVEDKGSDMGMPSRTEEVLKDASSNINDESAGMANILSITLEDEDVDAFRQGMVKLSNLKKCILRYPHGKCFYLNKGRVVADQSLQTDEASTGDGVYEVAPGTLLHKGNILPPEVLELIPDAKWLIFLPLFNYAHSQWYAAGFIWGNDFKTGDPDEVLPYFKTFGSCMMSEVASMEVLNTNIAKSTFIASVSHDLRSPLHGMLGSLEFLEDTMTSAYQMSLVGSMETCGKTLLDTIDHLLDYAKINNLNRASTTLAPSSGGRSSGDRGLDPLSGQGSPEPTSFDFSLLLEEVIEAVFAGQTFRKINLQHYDPVDDASAHVKAISLDESTPAEEQIHAGSAKFSGRVCLVLQIEKAPSWCVQGHTGALRRVIMNVVGNAIKYCKSGFIEVSAKLKQLNSTDVEVEFAVKDTGIGMSEDFMANHLFKAFSQEDSFTPGTGLGLSITSQIVDNLGGEIRIQSEKGVGTHVHVTVPMKSASSRSCTDSQENMLLDIVKVTSGKKLCTLNPKAREHGSQATQTKLESSIVSLCEGWFEMTCDSSSSVGDIPDTSIYVYAEPPPIEYLVEQHREQVALGKTAKEAALLIICTNAFEAAALRAAGVDHLISLGRVIEVISQPVGLRKLAKVLLQCLKRVERKNSDVSEPSHSGPPSPNFPNREVQKRAAEVRLNTSSVVYDQTATRYRPSIDALRWKSAEPNQQFYGDDSAAVSSTSLNQLETGGPSGSAIPHLDDSPEKKAKSPPRVLLVDDNAINLKLLVTFMKKIQLPYAEATNGLEALTTYKEAGQQAFDYVLMDLQMPVMDGFEATRRIRDFEQEQGISPASIIIAITGVGNEIARKEATEAGMSRYLTKPIKFKDLQQLLVKQ